MNDPITRFNNAVILLVETEEATAAAIEQHLEAIGAIVVRVTSLDTARERLAFISPEIIISNLQLCKENGFTLLLRVRAYERLLKHTRIPMIAIVGHSNMAGEVALEAGFQAYITTPITAANLYATLRRFV